MAINQLVTNEQALAAATAGRTAYAASVLRVFDNTLVPEVTTTEEQMVAKETTLVGYPSGGYPMATMGPALKGESGTAYFTTPLVPIVYASGPAVVVGGAWIEDGDGGTRNTFIFDPPISLAEVGDGFEFSQPIIFG